MAEAARRRVVAMIDFMLGVLCGEKTGEERVSMKYIQHHMMENKCKPNQEKIGQFACKNDITALINIH